MQCFIKVTNLSAKKQACRQVFFTKTYLQKNKCAGKFFYKNLPAKTSFIPNFFATFLASKPYS
ncbi:MAG: hypothetical protein EAZ95_04605 [Bacteroidetes bacterium]|nr:MAG: hypothetical protein EAZ95_04605 [Bacteroidota bacterium]